MSVTNRILNVSTGRPSLESLEVSVEEEVIAAGEATNELNDARAESDEIDRLQEVGDQTAQTVDYIESQVNAPVEAGENGAGATQNEVALAEQVANMATAGTGDSAETVMPSSESYIGSTISTEGFRERVRAIIKAVIEAIKRLWDRLKKFWKSTTSRLASIRRDAEEAKKRANGVSGSTKEKKIKISGSLAGNLSVGGSVKKSGSEMATEFKKLVKVVESCNSAVESAISAGDSVADLISGIDPEKASADLAKDSAAFIKSAGGVISSTSGLKDSSDKRYADTDVVVKCSADLLGDKKIFYRARTKFNGNHDAFRKAISARFSLDTYAEKAKEHTETEIATLSPSQVTDLCEEIIGATDIMIPYVDGNKSDKVTKAANKVEKALDRLNRELSSDDMTSDNAAAVRLMVSAGHAFCSWVRDPSAPVYNHTCTVMRSLLAVCNRSMAQY